MRKLILLLLLTFLLHISAKAESPQVDLQQEGNEIDAPAESPGSQELDEDRFGISMAELEQERGVYLEEGFFHRSAVSYLNALMVLRGAYNVDLSTAYAMTMDLIRERLHLGRFDYVPLPEPIIRQFVGEANARRGELTPESLVDLIEKHLLPEMKKILEETIDIRAAANITDAQKQTMIAVKAKEVGLTEGQLIRLMNSSYIYIPTITGLTRSVSDGIVTYTVNLGVVWYQVKAAQNEVVVRKKVFPMATTGSANMNREYLAYGGPDNFALHSALSAAVNNLVVGTREIADFNLSGQLVEKSGRRAKFELGNKEGLTLDDRFLFKILAEDAETGIAEYKELGFGFVTRVGRNKFDEGEEEVYDPSTLRIVKDNELISPGIVAFEHPTLGVDLDIRYQGMMASIATDSVVNYIMHGAGFHIYANIGRYLGISQLYLKPIGVGIGFGPNVVFYTGGDSASYSTAFMQYQFLGLQKRFYFSRAAVSVEIGPELIYYYYFGDGESLGIGGVTFYVDGGLEYALSKSLNLRAFGGMNFGGELAEGWQVFQNNQNNSSGAWNDSSSRGTGNFSKPRFSLALVWSVRKLPFDPWSLLGSFVAF